VVSQEASLGSDTDECQVGKVDKSLYQLYILRNHAIIVLSNLILNDLKYWQAIEFEHNMVPLSTLMDFFRLSPFSVSLGLSFLGFCFCAVLGFG